jgi:endogenous inhibitor of DNA gyrase (YacG/DUF329 family)
VPTCPTCKRALPEGAYEPPFPFCSQRCKLVDLHAWLNDRYVVSEALPLDDEIIKALTEDE